MHISAMKCKLCDLSDFTYKVADLIFTIKTFIVPHKGEWQKNVYNSAF